MVSGDQTSASDMTIRLESVMLRPQNENCAAPDATPIPPERQTTCAVIVTYHPDANLFGRLEKIAPQVHRTVIVDNGSSEQSVIHLKDIAARLGSHLILNPSNEGIARALNRGADWAISEGYAWMLMLDQDTTVAPDIVESLADIVRHDPWPKNLAVIGSNYTHKMTGQLNAAFQPHDDFASNEMISVLTSGSLLSLVVYRVLGPFRDDFFIDCVDHEYCLRARSHGFRVLMTSKPVMTHGIGHFTEHRLLGKNVGTSNHNPARQYFMSRNSVILAKKYLRKEPRWMLNYLQMWLKATVILCLFEDKRIPKIKSIVRGCIDGFLGHMNTPG